MAAWQSISRHFAAAKSLSGAGSTETQNGFLTNLPMINGTHKCTL